MKSTPYLERDTYLSEKTGIPHLKLSYEIGNHDFDGPNAFDLHSLLSELNDEIIFAEIESRHYGAISALTDLGFRLVSPSMAWRITSIDKILHGQSCRLVSLGDQPEIIDSIRKIALDFDSSHYAQFPRYTELIPKMYADKAEFEARKSGELIVYFSRTGEPVAFTTLRYSESVGQLCTSCVIKSSRNSRAYIEMISKGTDYLLNERKSKKVVVECLSGNIVVQKVWGKLGYLPFFSTVVLQRGALT